AGDLVAPSAAEADAGQSGLPLPAPDRPAAAPGPTPPAFTEPTSDKKAERKPAGMASASEPPVPLTELQPWGAGTPALKPSVAERRTEQLSNSPSPSASAAPFPLPRRRPALRAMRPLTRIAMTVAAGAGSYADGTYTGPAVDAYYGWVQLEAVVKGGRLIAVR